MICPHCLAAGVAGCLTAIPLIPYALRSIKEKLAKSQKDKQPSTTQL